MKILVTGSKGQLGRELYEKLISIALYTVVGHDYDTLDITNAVHVMDVVDQLKPDVIINTAAYTNVDGCESDYHTAYSVNALGASNIAKAAAQNHAKLIHISTDFVFDGMKKTAYFEYDATNPLSVYGKTKLAGEAFIRNECQTHFIIRTSWLYGKYGQNFVKTMIHLGKQKDSLSVVTDQVGSPTYATDLVDVICCLLESDYYGTYHFSNKNQCSWNSFAKEIFKLMDMSVKVLDTDSEAFKRPAKRPSFSVMDTQAVEVLTGICIRTWQDALTTFISAQKTELEAL